MNKLKLKQCAIFQKHFMRSVIIPVIEQSLKAIEDGELKTIEDVKAAGYKLLGELKQEYSL